MQPCLNFHLEGALQKNPERINAVTQRKTGGQETWPCAEK